jgi:hypothetical protein
MAIFSVSDRTTNVMEMQPEVRYLNKMLEEYRDKL